MPFAFSPSVVEASLKVPHLGLMRNLPSDNLQKLRGNARAKLQLHLLSNFDCGNQMAR
jgi:hypothetical protein